MKYTKLSNLIKFAILYLLLSIIFLVGSVALFTKTKLPTTEVVTTVVESTSPPVVVTPIVIPKPIEAVPPIVITPKPKPVPRDPKIPNKAWLYLSMVDTEQSKLLPGFKYPYYFAGLIEHESCITLRHSKCWSPTSQLKTSRELGIGMFQITKAYRSDGSLRFDTLANLRKKYSQQLKELTWDNIRTRPDLQIRAGMLLAVQNYQSLYQMTDVYQRLAASDAAYNGGLRSVRKRRTKCGLLANCDPQLWFDNLDRMVVKSTRPLYAGRSAQQINTEHVTKVFHAMQKYQPYFTGV